LKLEKSETVHETQDVCPRIGPLYIRKKGKKIREKRGFRKEPGEGHSLRKIAKKVKPRVGTQGGGQKENSDTEKSPNKKRGKTILSSRTTTSLDALK